MHPNLEIPQRHLMCAIGWTPFLTQYCYHWVVIRHQLLTNFYGPRLTHNPMRMFKRNIITGPNIPNFCRTCVCHQHTIHSVVQETPRWRREDCTWIFLRSTSRKSSLKKKILPWNENTDDIWQWEAGLGVCFVFSVMPHSFNPRTQYAQSGGLHVQNQLTHIVSSRPKTEEVRILIPPIKPTSKSLETYKSNFTFKILIFIFTFLLIL